MAIRTDGIKLSNLYLRDGSNTLVPLNEAYIGDMVGKDTVSSEQLGSFLLKVNNFMTGGSGDGTVAIPDVNNFHLKKDNNEISLIYKEPESTNEISLGTFTDTDTLYNYHIEITEDEQDADQKYLTLTESVSGTRESVSLPKEGQKLSFTVESGLGKFSIQE